jgi:molybdate transport system substrate-binding protein
MKKLRHILISALVLLPVMGQASAAEIHVAVASNFTDAIKDIVRVFEQETGHKVTLIFGSTGKHYAQISNGAPFDAFFAADVRRPERLEKEGVARPGSRFTYAIGKVVLWSPEPALVDAQASVLSKGGFRYLALANPKLAPYGKAAQQVMTAKGVWSALQGRMVRGENIGQTFSFVKSGNAELGFVALSQISKPGADIPDVDIPDVDIPDVDISGSFWLPPQSLYDPIEQQAVLLKENATAAAFLGFAKSDQARAIIRGYGYGTP